MSLRLSYSHPDLILYPYYYGINANSLLGIPRVETVTSLCLTWLIPHRGVYCESDKTVFLIAIMSAHPPYGPAILQVKLLCHHKSLYENIRLSSNISIPRSLERAGFSAQWYLLFTEMYYLLKNAIN